MQTRWEKWSAIGSLIGASIALLSVGVSYSQLRSSIHSNEQQISSNEQQIRSLSSQMKQAGDSVSMQAVTGYLNSPELIDAKKMINARTQNGTDYSAVPQDPELYNAVQAVLNYLQTVSTGIKNGVYNDTIMCNSLKLVVQKQVEVHIKGQRPTGVVKSNPGPFSATEFSNLNEVYERWNKSQSCPS